MPAALVAAGLETAKLEAVDLDTRRLLLHHLGHGPVRRVIQAAASNQGLSPAISILILCPVFSSCGAGTLLWAAASITETQDDKLRITSTNIAASPLLAVAPAQGLGQSLRLCNGLNKLASCGAGMLRWVVRSVAMARFNNRSITATTTRASPFHKRFIHFQLLPLIICNRMDEWNVTALLHCWQICKYWVQGQDDTQDEASHNHAALWTRISQAAHQIRHKRASICYWLYGLLQQLMALPVQVCRRRIPCARPPSRPSQNSHSKASMSQHIILRLPDSTHQGIFINTSWTVGELKDFVALYLVEYALQSTDFRLTLDGKPLYRNDRQASTKSAKVCVGRF